MDDSERDKFYSPPRPAEDEDDELELEEPDEAVEERRRQDILAAQPPQIDVDEIYREAERDYGGEILETWVRNFRLGIEHLVIAPAVIVIAVALIQLHLFWSAAVIFIMLFIGGVYFYVSAQERKRHAELDRKRDELYAKRREHFAARAPGAHPVASILSPPVKSVAVGPPVEDEANDETKLNVRDPFRFQVSPRALLITVTCVVIALGLVRWLGGREFTAVAAGIVATIGLIAFAAGARPAQVVVLSWWFTLVAYILICILAASTSAFA
jgi:hypothetical protein